MLKKAKRGLVIVVSLLLFLSLGTQGSDAAFVVKSTMPLRDGEYTVDLEILKEDGSGTSNAGSYFSKSKVKMTIEEGVARVELRYSDGMIGGLGQVFGEEIKTLPVTEEKNEKYITLQYESLNEIAYLYMEIDTNSFFGVMKHKVQVVLNTSTINQVGGGIALSDGEYTVSYDIWKEAEDVTSSAASYFETKDAQLVIKDGVAKLKMLYSSPMIGGLQQVYGEIKTTLDVTVTGQGNYVELAFDKLEESSSLYMEIDTNSFWGVMQHIVRVKLQMDTLRKDGELVFPVVPEATITPQPTPTPPTETPAEENVEDGVYEIQIALWNASEEKASMANAAIQPTARVVVKNNKATMYLYTNKMSLGTIEAYLQEMKVITASNSYIDAVVKAKDTNGNPTCFAFPLPAMKEFIAVKVNPHVAMMGNQDIAARLKLDIATMKKITDRVDLSVAPGKMEVKPTTEPTEKPQTTEKPQSTTKPQSSVKPTQMPTPSQRPSTSTTEQKVQISMTKTEPTDQVESDADHVTDPPVMEEERTDVKNTMEEETLVVKQSVPFWLVIVTAIAVVMFVVVSISVVKVKLLKKVNEE